MAGIVIHDVADDFNLSRENARRALPGFAGGRGKLGDGLSVAGDNDRVAGMGDFVDEGEAPCFEFCGGDGVGLHDLIVALKWTIVQINEGFRSEEKLPMREGWKRECNGGRRRVCGGGREGGRRVVSASAGRRKTSWIITR